MQSFASFEEDSDPEILQAQHELRELQRQRRRLELRAKIEHEKRLFAQAQQRTEASDPLASSEEPHGRKRPRSESMQSERPPSKPATETKYQGKTMREFSTFVARMEYHFRRYDNYFVTDERKVAEAVGQLSDALLLKWAQHEKDLSGVQPTWREFHEFFLYLINDPVNLLRQASQKYTDARQMPHQSVRDFAAYLAQWEAQLSEPYTEGQRKEHLRTRVLEEVRREALKYPKEPDTYDSFISHLNTIEDSILSRRAAIRRGSSNQQDHSHTPRQWGANQGSRSSSAHSAADSRMTKPGSSMRCHYCDKIGHKREDCRKRAYDESRKQTATNQMSKN
jgi:hypothetical protein